VVVTRSLHAVWRVLSHRLGGLLPGARARRRQVVAFAGEWERAGAAALAAEGPLLAVLGDSSAQAIGASARTHGWAHGVLDALRAADPTWQLVNLSRTGARIADVRDGQLPALARLPREPGAVLVAIGANDVRHGTPGLLGAVADLVAALPDGAVVATVPQGLNPRRTRAVNEVLRRAARSRGLRVADVWARTGPPWRAKFSADLFHPNDLGYADWTAAFLEALDLPAPPAVPAVVGPTRREQLRCLAGRLRPDRRAG
jgi:lysophospholipase L1-like esterase